MQARMKHPGIILPDVMPALVGLGKVVATSAIQNGVPQATLELVHLRASQINGCSVCVGGHASAAEKGGERAKRLLMVSAWREAPLFTDAERAALELTEAMTRMQDRGDAVSDEIWNEAAKHYSEAGLAALIVSIATVNMWNRLNASSRQVAGAWEWTA
jgi:AhpD family alkylhydroperoxidase